MDFIHESFAVPPLHILSRLHQIALLPLTAVITSWSTTSHRGLYSGTLITGLNHIYHLIPSVTNVTIICLPVMFPRCPWFSTLQHVQHPSVLSSPHFSSATTTLMQMTLISSFPFVHLILNLLLSFVQLLLHPLFLHPFPPPLSEKCPLWALADSRY